MASPCSGRETARSKLKALPFRRLDNLFLKIEAALAKASCKLAEFLEFLAWILAMPPAPIGEKSRLEECPSADLSQQPFRNVYSYTESGCVTNKKAGLLSPARNSLRPCDMPAQW